jgi:REP element-mobilizing transposase RayT
VTLVTWNRVCILGKIINGEIYLNDIGKIAQVLLMKIPEHFPNVELESFVIMPNHIHAIITIVEPDCRGTIYRAPTGERFGKPVAGSIPTIIRSYKAAVSRQVKRQLGMIHIWQRNYYEHIVRNEREMNNITAYVISNPAQWLDDPEYIR